MNPLSFNVNVDFITTDSVWTCGGLSGSVSSAVCFPEPARNAGFLEYAVAAAERAE